jgi:hypothetical protein
MMHPNEIRITNENRETLENLATSLGPAYTAALNEQIRRQREG